MVELESLARIYGNQILVRNNIIVQIGVIQEGVQSIISHHKECGNPEFAFTLDCRQTLCCKQMDGHNSIVATLFEITVQATPIDLVEQIDGRTASLIEMLRHPYCQRINLREQVMSLGTLDVCFRHFLRCARIGNLQYVLHLGVDASLQHSIQYGFAT